MIHSILAPKTAQTLIDLAFAKFIDNEISIIKKP